MNYRVQDLMKLIIPGLHVVAFIIGWYLLFPNKAIDILKIKDFTSVLMLLIPFVGFVVGYFIECVMSTLEHIFYLVGGRRPSKTILSGGFGGLYVVNSARKILAKHCISKSISNAKANEIVQIAKQVIDREKVESFRLNSMLARNIFGGQLLLTILYGFISICFYKDGFFYFLLFVSFLFLFYWFHHTHIYVKYVLAEYGKSLK